ncbi:2-polyprenyl-6-methoxyphenol hydroxylase-like FAD-dependent oxidoreductase [Peteryoungia aggregata LMG 23059]|uniref:2-polyprenyl-6-methoxyphenol hydroxylase-like FAD-dependent oxidoreductase n=1 Tax=Peteryoungia aggregata LMG 23059 TaxID=1368425 RepID=A0ABU0G2I3_9HYPH|nr:FAD-dependent oxidoreductase [Peteryoungia aggregata]MDQ0419537.1 2-polyprenyl-6-methoxyphenol hydroxylase-like FAD-dependent oxidoreductase [Peteryoungia aggregata LMG 23059]
MNSGIKKILVIGGGFAGMTAALQLSRQGFEVDLVEIDAGWRSYGAGISLHGSTLRVIKQLGLIDQFMQDGFASDGVELRGPNDAVLVTIPTPRVAGPDIPGGGAILRPALAKLLSQAVRASSTHIRLGVTFTDISRDEDGATVTFNDGSSSRYDLVIGADGLYSAVRAKVFPEAPKPRFIGQSVWRAVLPRPEGIDTVTMWMGPKLKVGVNRVTEDLVYLFLTEDRATNDYVPPETFVETLRSLLERFPSPTIRKIASELSSEHQIVYRPLEQMLLPRPWHRDRIALIGDAVHATTPHLAAGACIGIEDAMVLAEELVRGNDVQSALGAFEERRWERCRMVVENSGRLADIEMHDGSREEHAAIMQQSMKSLAQAI